MEGGAAGRGSISRKRSLQMMKQKLMVMMTMMITTIILLQLMGRADARAGPRHLRFFMYIAVKNESLPANRAAFTAIQSAQPNQSQPNSFGIIHTFENPLTTQPSLLAPRIGRVQGWYGDVGQTNLTLFLAQTFTVATPKYRGTFSLLGADVASEPVKFSPIVGGTGDFAYARGVAAQSLTSTTFFNNETISWFNYDIRFKY